LKKVLGDRRTAVRLRGDVSIEELKEKKPWVSTTGKVMDGNRSSGEAGRVTCVKKKITASNGGFGPRSR